MQKLKTAFLTFPLIASAAAVSAETASSPATMCRVQEGTGAVYWDGRTVNQSTTNLLHLNCPLITSGVAPVVRTAKAVFIDVNRNQDASCRVTSQWILNTGEVRWWQSAEMRSSGYAPGTQTRTASVNFGALGENLNFQCSVPPKTSDGHSAVLRYEITR